MRRSREMTTAPTEPLTGIPTTELEARRERLLELVRSRGSDGLRRLRRALHPLPGGALVPLDGTARRLRAGRGRRGGRLRPGVRGRARPGRDVVRDRRVVPRVPGHRAPDGDPRARARRPRDRAAAIGADQDGYPGILGYHGPTLSEATGASITSLAVELEAMLARKSEAEIALIRQSARWCEHAHRLLQDSTRPGVTEAEASLHAGHEATLALLRAAGGARRGPARVRGRRAGGLPGADRLGAARGRTRSPTTSSFVPATSSSPRRAPRSGATTQSSSVRS